MSKNKLSLVIVTLGLILSACANETPSTNTSSTKTNNKTVQSASSNYTSNIPAPGTTPVVEMPPVASSTNPKSSDNASTDVSQLKLLQLPPVQADQTLSAKPAVTPTTTTSSASSNKTPQAPSQLDTIIASGDYLKCKDLTAADQITLCETNLLTAKAVSTNDQTWCQKATQDTAKTDCLNSLNKKNTPETASKLDEIISAGDYTRCKELTSADQITLCETNILTAKAVSTNDQSWCQKATIADAKTSCLYSLNKK